MAEEGTPANAPAATTTRVYTEAEVAEFQAAVRKANGEAGGYKAEAGKAKERAEAAEARLTQREAEHADALTKSGQRYVRSEAKTSAVRAGAVDAADVLALLDMSKVEMKDGEPSNLDALVAELKTAKPYLFATAAAASGSSSNPQRAPTPAPAGGKNAKDMTQDEYEAARSAIAGRRGW